MVCSGRVLHTFHIDQCILGSADFNNELTLLAFTFHLHLNRYPNIFVTPQTRCCWKSICIKTSPVTDWRVVNSLNVLPALWQPLAARLLADTVHVDHPLVGWDRLCGDNLSLIVEIFKLLSAQQQCVMNFQIYPSHCSLTAKSQGITESSSFTILLFL